MRETFGRATVSRFKKELNRRVLVNLSTGDHLQSVLQENRTLRGCPHPVDLIDDMADFLEAQCNGEALQKVSGEKILAKAEVPLQQVMAVYAVASIVERLSAKERWKQMSNAAEKVWKALPGVQRALPLGQ